MQSFYSDRSLRARRASSRRKLLSVERLEGRELMASDLYVITNDIPGEDVRQGQQDVVAAEFRLVGRGTVPQSLSFASETGTVRNVVRNPELMADLYGTNARGYRTRKPDGIAETRIAVGKMDAIGNVTFNIAGWGPVLAARGTELEFRYDVAANAADDVAIGYSLPKVGFPKWRALHSKVHHIGYDNPVHVVNVPETARMHAAERSIVSTNVAVAGEDNILLNRVEFTAVGDDQLLTGMTFNVMQGNGRNIDSVAVLVDSDGNGVVDTVLANPVRLTPGAVDAFVADFPYPWVVEGGRSVVVELWGEVADSLPPVNPTIRTGLASFDAEVLSDGAPSKEVIDVFVPQTEWTFFNQGDLFVTLDSTPTRSRQLLGGTLEQPILRTQLRAQNEDVEVYKLYVSLTGVVTSVDRLELFKEGATTPFATATIGAVGSDPVPAGYTTFAAIMQNTQLVVPEGSNVDVLVRPRMKSDEYGAVSGEVVKANLVTTAGFQPVLARGRMSSKNLLPNDGNNVATGEVIVGRDGAGQNADVVGNPNRVVLSKFTSFANANPDADNTNVPTGVSPFAQFRIMTATNSNTLGGINRAALDSFVIYVNATNVSMDASAFKIYNKADSSTKVAVIAESLAGVPLTGQATGNFRVRVSGLSASAVDAVFDSGETSTLVLEGNVLNSKINAASTSVLQGSLSLTDEFFSWYDQDALGRKKINGVEYSDTVIHSTLYRS